MANQNLLSALLLLFLACGGRESGDPPVASSTGPGGGGSVAGGTGGSIGTVATGVGGSNTAGGVGGANTAGQSGVGGSGQGGADWSSCSTSMDTCVLEAVGACGPGCEPVPLSAFTAINSTHLAEYNQSIAGLRCNGPQCFPVSPDQANTPNYFAECLSGHCEPMDVRTSLVSACTDNSDCYLRSGTTCCGCGNGNLIAVSKKANVEAEFCGGSACAADCVSAPLPPGVVARCLAGHCLVQLVPDSGTP